MANLPARTVLSCALFPNNVGDKFRLEVKDSDGVVIPNRLITWTTGNAGRATVDADGVVTGVATGSAATITATFQTKTDTASITVS